jgi:cellulose synthase/poly-beta-1,6-N-acetylglucosamine synthase-like glycosyltransferase
METIGIIGHVIGLMILVPGVARLLLLPFAAWFSLRRRTAGPRSPADRAWTVSVIVPAYNEGKVLGACARSIAGQATPPLEIIVVDDGSTDDTPTVVAALSREIPLLRGIRQANAGKGAALNAGLRAARGEIVLLVDADGVFARGMIAAIVAPFADPRVAAVCGDDRPVNLDRALTRLLAVTGHVGTGLMRRALDVLGCLPVVSGNAGAFRVAVLRELGGLDEHTLGEDLELTWRIHGAGHRVRFEPDALVYAESPSTLRGLWRQRVRWARGLLQSVRRHRGWIGDPRRGVFGLALVPITWAATVSPVLQMLALPPAIALIAAGVEPIPGWWEVVLWLGLALSAGLMLLACVWNGATADLRHAWALPLWPAYSVLLTLVALAGLSAELRRRPQTWNKLERTAVVSVDAARPPMDRS